MKQFLKKVGDSYTTPGGRSSISFPDITNASIHLACVRENGIEKIYVNGILLSAVAKNYVMQSSGKISYSRVQQLLRGKAPIISPVIDAIVNGTTYPQPPMHRNYMLGTISYARMMAGFKPKIEWEFGRRDFPIRSDLGDHITWYRISVDEAPNYRRDVYSQIPPGRYPPGRFVL